MKRNKESLSITDACIEFNCRDRNTGIWDEVSIVITGVSCMNYFSSI
jgi:hypothetical protein